MKKLSEFKDEKAVEVVARLSVPIMEVVSNPKNAELAKDATVMQMFSGFLANNPRQMMDIFAILSETDPKKYHCTGIEVTKNLLAIASDEELKQLFT